MSKLNEPLSEAELDELDQFMLNRFPDVPDTEDGDAETDFGDEGLLSLTELDGFLTAVVSGPETVPPSVWLPAVWGDVSPNWQNEKQFQHIMGLLFRHMNTTAAYLMTAPDEFEPLMEQREIDGTIVEIPDDWCEGYLRAVRLSPDAWSTGGEPMEQMLTVLRSFSEESDWLAHRLGERMRDDLAADVVPAVRDIHAFWLAQRTLPQPKRNASPPVGRNDPCPCGSGQKYKKCCLQ